MIEALQIGVTERVAQKAAHMAQIDPNGLTLTLVCVSVVFGVLFFLFIAYAVSGEFFMRKRKIKQALKNATHADKIFQQDDDDESAAIAMALHLYLSDTGTHDKESGVITIKR